MPKKSEFIFSSLRKKYNYVIKFNFYIQFIFFLTKSVEKFYTYQKKL